MRVILADDAVLFREGVARILAEVGIEVVRQVGDAESLLKATETDRPDAVIVDIRMPPTHTTEGLDAATRIRRAHPGVAVLVLSQYVETRHALDLIGDGKGAFGYLLKERISDVTVLRDSLERLLKGESVFDPEVVAVMLGRRRQDDPLARLSAREREILGLMAEGRSNHAVGQSLHLSTNTVESHIRSLLSKLGLFAAPDDHRRVLAVLSYLGR